MKYCWIDLETTGLEYNHGNEIVEIAAIITDGFFQRIDQFHAIVKPSKKCMWHNEVVTMHYNTGLMQEVISATKTFDQILPDFIAFLKKHGADSLSLTPAGNSVHFDMEFLKHTAPELDQYFFHRHLDVSSIRVTVMELYGKEARAPLKPNHRAMDDLSTSMAELEYYLNQCFKPVLAT